MKFGSDFSWLWAAIFKIFTAPFYLVLWCINVVKSAIGMFIFWIIAKICVTLVLLALLGGIHYLFKESSENFLAGVLGWYYPNIMGWSTEPWMTAGQIFEAPKGGASFFPYPHIEVPIMIVLTLIVATTRTIYREEFD
ncbi:hypothetical protein [Streptococcus sinensis]|uniref:Uncharacterized protein n=1 Tax=Streptococcus sinensis TaxID=176090 RepID=A0A0A0DE66_9STRE|nr:hypothetical protein [Streptococcus sinensis]KGM37006.1 hypothetical protein SSIN_1148 [Streptococcus sinensis]